MILESLHVAFSQQEPTNFGSSAPEDLDSTFFGKSSNRFEHSDQFQDDYDKESKNEDGDQSNGGSSSFFSKATGSTLGDIRVSYSDDDDEEDEDD